MSTKANLKETKQLGERFKSYVYWNEYNIEIKKKKKKNRIKISPLRIRFDASFQTVKRFFVLVFNKANNNDGKVKRNNHQKYFLSIIYITNYNVLIDVRNFYDQASADEINKYDEITMIATGQEDDYTS